MKGGLALTVGGTGVILPETLCSITENKLVFYFLTF